MKDNNNSFSYSYSGATNDELQKIKEKYTVSEKNRKLNEVKRLDARVDFTATMISIAIGIIGTFLLVHGIIFIVQNPEKIFYGSAAALFGVTVAAVVPIIHFKIAAVIKKRTAPKILSLIEEIEQNKL